MEQESFPTILLVDDDPDNLADRGRVLCEPGFRVITARDGDSAAGREVVGKTQCDFFAEERARAAREGERARTWLLKGSACVD